MPKGRVAPREMTCRACGSVFVTDKVGKASFYCREAVCDERRRVEGIRVRTVRGSFTSSPALARLDRIARRVMAAQAAEERRRERFEVMWRREVEAWLWSLDAPARRAAAVAERRRAREAKMRADRRAREAGRARARARTAAEAMRPRLAKAQERAQRLADELAALERAAGIVGPAEAAEAPIADERLAAIAAALAQRPLDAEAGRGELRRAITRLANATGLAQTRAALRDVAVEALAWERRLPKRVQAISGIDTDRDIAA
jgi:hypothetical protein